jgi:hypothetical protein
MVVRQLDGMRCSKLAQEVMEEYGSSRCRFRGARGGGIGNDVLTYRLNLIRWCFMLDQQRLRFLSTIDDLPDRDADVLVVLARVRLRRLAPASGRPRRITIGL